ncbi:hypothetical protein D0860_08459 [Hortaea werneckii]|uniref:Ig-like domain-containing protein n=1 Tax=Hortaea werneckii TaxID=91943 RepID=A0A3M7GDA8_HORWE|nr:hypothetical protein D0860_08459 [Hortaea werneckii]
MSRLSILSSLNLLLLLLLASLLPPPTTALPRPQAADDDPFPAPATTLTLTTTETTTTCPSSSSSSTTTTPTAAAVLTSSPTHLIPAPTGPANPPFPTNTTLTLYQGRRCQYRVGSSPISSSECQAFRTEWVGVPRDATRNCTFAVWLGDDFCGSGGGGGGEVRSTFVESLEGMEGEGEVDEEVCVYVGVLQPGVYHGSGVWTCG